jgi:hypothetical protein
MNWESIDVNDLSAFVGEIILTFWDLSRYFNSILIILMINANFQHLELAGSRVRILTFRKTIPTITSNRYKFGLIKSTGRK